MISANDLEKAFSYAEYRNLLDTLMAQGKTTGPDQSESMVEYGKMNLQRMQRLEKTVELTEELKSALDNLQEEIIFLVLTEGWCGDAAQNVPVFYFMQQYSSKVELKLLLRDENMALIDQYLTNGSRAIPKLICIEKETLKELFVWGPRPAPCQELAMQLKQRHATSKEKGEQVHLWYARDKTQTLQKEFVELLKTTRI